MDYLCNTCNVSYTFLTFAFLRALSFMNILDFCVILTLNDMPFVEGILTMFAATRTVPFNRCRHTKHCFLLQNYHNYRISLRQLHI